MSDTIPSSPPAPREPTERPSGQFTPREGGPPREGGHPREGGGHPREGGGHPREGGGHPREGGGDGPGRGGGPGGPGGRRRPYYRRKVDRTRNLDITYRKPEILERFITQSGKILPRRVTGTSAKNQRRLARQIKLARVLALLPYKRQGKPGDGS